MQLLLTTPFQHYFYSANTDLLASADDALLGQKLAW